MGLDNDKYELKLIMAFGVPAETQMIDAIDSNPDGSINYWRDDAQVHHVPKRRSRRAGVAERHRGVIRR